MLSHKEITSHVRNRLKASGIKARVKMNEACGSKYVTVVVPNAEARFTRDEIRTICIIAKGNGFTYVRNLPINPDIDCELTGRIQWDFYL